MKKDNKRLQLMSEAPVKKALVALAVPSVIAMFVNALYNFIDTLFVGMLGNTDAMAGVSVGFPVFIMILAIGQLVGIGTSSYAGRKLGSGEQEIAERAAGIAVWLGVGFAILSMIIGLTFLEPILSFMGATPEVMPYAIDYGKYMVLGSLFTIINMTFNNLLRTEGAAKMSMTTLILGAVVNIILDPIFMFDWGLGLGVAGAAMATVIAQMCSTVYILSFYIRKKSIIKINKISLFQKTGYDKEIVVNILKVGSPIFAMQILSSVAFGLLNSAAGAYGAAALATLGISNKIYSMVIQVIQGYIQAFLPFTAFNVGAKQMDRVKEGLKFSLILIGILTLVATTVFNIVPEVFIRMFTQDQEVIELGVNCLKAQTYMLVAVGCINIFNAFFQATGRAKEAAVLAFSRQGIFFIPMVIFLPKIFEQHVPVLFTYLVKYPMEGGLYGVMFAQGFADIMTFVLAAVLAIRALKSILSTKMTQSNEQQQPQEV